jgi:O-antigen ligase
VRLNYEEADGVLSNIENFLKDFGREDIWRTGLAHIEEWHFLGTGVASVSNYLSDVSDGFLKYSGYHNLTITILAERGLFLGSLFILLLLVILAKLLLNRSWRAIVYFGGFLVFSHTTGVEFVLHSDSARNANVLFALFLIFFRLTHTERERYVQARI